MRRRDEIDSRIPTQGDRRKRRRWVLVAIGCMGFACALPGQLYRVAPEIRGEIGPRSAVGTEPTLRLSIMSREVPTLFDVKMLGLQPDRRFRFDSAQLAIAGREYSKVYRAFLRYREGAKDEVIWRAEFSRRDLADSIELDCDLTRPARLGQPCRVREPLRHRWLLANGEATFDRLCAECHGVGGQQGAQFVSAVEPAAPDLRRIASRRKDGFNRDEVAEWIEGSLIPRGHGSLEMPVWGERLSDEYSRYSNTDELVGATLDPVLAFLSSIQTE